MSVQPQILSQESVEGPQLRLKDCKKMHTLISQIGSLKKKTFSESTMQSENFWLKPVLLILKGNKRQPPSLHHS